MIAKQVRENAIWTFLTGVLIGAVAFLCIYGVEPLRFTNINWLTHSKDLEGLWDLTQHYYGWVFYRNTPWTFPIGMTQNISSVPISVVYTDSIPLFAVFFKMLSPVLPTTFQYFGLFEIICYMLMGGFGALITYRFSKNIVFNSISAGLFVISPVLTKRAFYHTALSAHFLILAAICLWINRDRLSEKKHLILWSILIVVSLLINPYYVPMTYGILLCSLLQKLIVDRNWKSLILPIVLPMLCSVCFAALLGMFSGGVEMAGRSLELVSFNLNQLFNSGDPYLKHISNKPMFTGDIRNYSTFMKEKPLYNDWQMEGFSYLGLGVIVMMVLSVLIGLFCYEEKVNESNRRVVISYIVAIALGVAVYVFLAVSPVATFGASKIYEIHWPAVIYNLLSVFRTCGRLIWPVYYGIMALTLIVFSQALNKRRVMWVVIVLLVVVQILDLGLPLLRKRNNYKNIGYSTESFEYNPLLNSDVMDYIADNYDEIIFLPENDMQICLSGYWSCMFEQYSLEKGLRLSAAYCSRDVSKTADAYATKNIESRRNGETYPKVLYVGFYDHYIDEVSDVGLNYYYLKAVRGLGDESLIIGTDEDLSASDELVEYKKGE